MSGIASLAAAGVLKAVEQELEFVYKVIISPPLRVAGWIPYELILTLFPHFLPSAFQFNATRITEDEDAGDHLSNLVKHDLIRRIDEIKQRVYPHAVAPAMTLYTKEENKVVSSGGFLSIQTPTLTLPARNGLIDQLRIDRESELGIERGEEEALDIDEQDIIFNKDETEFLITREVLRVKLQAGLIRIVALGVLFALAVGLSHLAMPTILASVISWGVYALIFSSGQYQIEYRIDRKAFRILQDLYNAEGRENPTQAAYRTMYNTYRKTQASNLKTRESHWWHKIYIMPNGNDLWDMFSRPAVTWQIDKYARRAGIVRPDSLELQEA